jgi:HEAT repeat protein
MRAAFGGLAGLLAMLVASVAAAAPPAVAPAGGGQAALGVGFDAAGELRAKACADAACSIEGGVKLGLPVAFAKLRDKTRLAVVGIGLGRRAIVVTVPGARGDQRWEAVVAAAPGGAAPLVVFAGVTGYSTGEDGLRRGAMVTISEPEPDGARRILVGEQHEELTLCGRPTMLGPRLLDPKDLALKPAKLQRLPQAERDSAPKLTAERVAPGTAPPRPLLRALGASSAVGNPAALSDGNLESTWAENRGGSGRGEFVVFRAPSGVPLHGVELAVRPPAAQVAKGIAPRELWVATAKSLYLVTLPDDGFREPGTRYSVRFPESVQDDCVAIALESAFGERPDAEVTLAEVSVTTGLDSIDLPSVVDALAAGGQRAEQAKPLLRALGQPAFEALVARFEKLGDNARLDALDVLDGAACETSAPAYVAALAGPFETHYARASEKLRRCGAAATPSLAAALEKTKGADFQRLASEFADISPNEALAAFVPLLKEENVAARRSLRVALGRAARLPRAVPAFQKVLAEPSLPEPALLDILRALGDRAPSYLPLSGAALSRLGGENASFRVRFLRLGTAGALAARDAAARSLLLQGLVDADGRLRAQAIESVREPAAFQNELVARLADPEVRVRMAAARVLAGAPDGAATPALMRLLEDDRWPAVRALSATALGRAKPNAALDQRLSEALADTSPHVRRELVLALGARGARAHDGAVLERVEDRDEAPEVRAAAARVLGELCSDDGLGTLTKHARKLADRFASTEQRALSVAALGSLSRIGPKDLKSRLAPLLDEEAPPVAQAAARSALATRPACGQRG